MRSALLVVMALLFSAKTFAIVDMKSANYSETWTALTVPGLGYDLRVSVTYNSRSLFNGQFGYGWCSDFETKLEMTAESNLKLTECGAGMETVYMTKSYRPDQVASTIKQIMADVKQRRPDLQPEYLSSLESELKSNEFLRDEFSHRLGLRGKISEGATFYANGREAESIVLRNGSYKRTMADGTYEIFDMQGHMTYMYDKNSNYLKLSWERDQLMTVTDNMGRKLTFKYSSTSHKISDIYGPGTLAAHFTVKGEDLTEIFTAEKEKYFFAYDDVHNMTRIDYPDRTYKALTYNKDKDWVTSFRNQKGCVETYEYEVSKEDPKNHFWSNVEKKCATKVTNRSKYEFFQKKRPDGLGVYLYRVKADNNGDVTDIVYHETYGKPLSVTRNNQKTDYTYFGNGLVHTKTEINKIMTYEYKNSCNKVSMVETQFLQDMAMGRAGRRQISSTGKKNVAKTVVTKFFYDSKKCNLDLAENSDGQKVKLQYDVHGRISQIEDQSRKIVKIKYEESFGKPSVVTRPGLGTIFVSYRPDGEISKVESKEGPNVAIQVASIFNNLLDIIAPATSETPL